MGLLSPADFRYRLRLSPPGISLLLEACASGLRSGLSLHPLPEIRGLGAARLVSTPSRLMSRRAWLGIATSRGFPDFEQFCIAGFPAGTQVFLKSAASAIPPRPRGCTVQTPMIGQVCLNLHPSRDPKSAGVWDFGGVLLPRCFGCMTAHDSDRQQDLRWAHNALQMENGYATPECVWRPREGSPLCRTKTEKCTDLFYHGGVNHRTRYWREHGDVQRRQRGDAWASPVPESRSAGTVGGFRFQCRFLRFAGDFSGSPSVRSAQCRDIPNPRKPSVTKIWVRDRRESATADDQREARARKVQSVDIKTPTGAPAGTPGMSGLGEPG